MEELILTTLEQLAAEGFEPDMVEAAVNTIEFSLRENNTGSYPARAQPVYALAARVDRTATTPSSRWATSCRWPWSSGGWPKTPCFLSKLIQTYLLDNRHRVTVLLKPDPNAAASWRPRKRSAWLPPRPP